MTREEAKKRLEVWLICSECPEDKQCYDSYLHSACEYTDYCDEVSITDAVKVAISALSENKGEWIPIVTRPMTEEEKEEYLGEYDPNKIQMYDCPIPEDGQEVLVTTRYGDVTMDTFYRDDGCYFETYCDEGDVIAWRPKPEPYQKGSE